MENDSQESDPGAPAERPFQYSLRDMLIVTAVFATAFSLLIGSPGIVRFVTAACLTVLLPAMLTVALIYSRGYRRTFCIGALFPAGVVEPLPCGPV